MQYIWEVVLAAEKNGIREADLRYEVAEVRSPYLEVSFCDLNTQTVEQTVVEVNPFYRFFDIFSEILDINQKGYEKTREIFVDTVFHYLALTDLRMGTRPSNNISLASFRSSRSSISVSLFRMCRE